jgi:hypothetical protein
MFSSSTSSPAPAPSHKKSESAMPLMASSSNSNIQTQKMKKTVEETIAIKNAGLAAKAEEEGTMRYGHLQMGDLIYLEERAPGLTTEVRLACPHLQPFGRACCTPPPPTHTPASTSTPAHTCTHLHTPAHTCTHLLISCSSVHTCALALSQTGVGLLHADGVCRTRLGLQKHEEEGDYASNFQECVFRICPPLNYEAAARTRELKRSPSLSGNDLLEAQVTSCVLRLTSASVLLRASHC